MSGKKSGPRGKWGGARPGSGPKRKSAPLVSYSVDVTHAQASLLRAWGGGDISAGLRWLVDAAKGFVVETRRRSVTPPPQPPPE